MSKYSCIFDLFFYLCSNIFKSFHGAISPSLMVLFISGMMSPQIWKIINWKPLLENNWSERRVTFMQITPFSIHMLQLLLCCCIYSQWICLHPIWKLIYPHLRTAPCTVCWRGGGQKKFLFWYNFCIFLVSLMVENGDPMPAHTFSTFWVVFMAKNSPKLP